MKSKIPKDKIYLVNQLRVNHDYFDTCLTEELERLGYTPSWICFGRYGYVAALIVALLWRSTVSGQVVWVSISNWIIPVLPSEDFVIVHNNLERRKDKWLVNFRGNILCTSSGQMSYFDNPNFLGHPVRKVENSSQGLVKSKCVALLDTCTELDRIKNWTDKYGLSLVVGRSCGIGFIPDIEYELSRARVLILDRDYRKRSSSIVAMALASGCHIVHLDKMSAKNLSSSFGVHVLNDDFSNINPYQPFDMVDYDGFSHACQIIFGRNKQN